MRPRVLLTDADQRSTLAAARGLAEAGYEVVVAGGRWMAPTFWSRACAERVRLPDAGHASIAFCLGLEDTLRRGRFDTLLAGTDSALLVISSERARFEDLTCLGLPPHEAVLGSLSKLALREAAEQVGLAGPAAVVCDDAGGAAQAAEELGYPVMVKPVSSLVHSGGATWRQPGAAARSPAELCRAVAAAGSPVIVERYETNSAIVSCSGAYADGRLLTLATARYVRTWPRAAGGASLVYTIDPPAGLAEATVGVLDLLGWSGIFQLQLLELESGRLAAIDLNPRLYGSLALAVESGANIPAAWCDWLLRGVVHGSVARPRRSYRWEEGEIRNSIALARVGGLGAAVEILRPRPAVVYAYLRRDDPGPFAAWLAGVAGRSVRRLSTNNRSPSPVIEDEIRVLDDRESLEQVAAEWRVLAESRGNIFVTPEWYCCWLDEYGAAAGVEPLVISVRGRDGVLKGVMPFVRSTAGRHGRITFAGANLGDHFHPACAPNDEAMVAAAAAQALAARRSQWGSLVLHNVQAGAAWVDVLVRSCPSQLTTTIDEPHVLPSVELTSCTWDSYLATRSSNLRSQIGRKLRRLEGAHDVEFRVTSDADAVSSDMRTFFELHDQRWRGRGGSSVASEHARRFHTAFAAAALHQGWLRLWLLEIDQQPVASWYGWSIGRRYLYYLAGFDPAWAESSVGLILLARTIRAAIEEKAVEYDMLLGDEAYKSRFATHERVVRTEIVTPRFAAQRVLAELDLGLRRAGRALPPELRDITRSSLGRVLARLPSTRRR